MNWPTPMIGDVCLPTLQGYPARSGRKSFRYVDIAGVDRESKSISGADEMQSREAPSRARKMIEASDVLVSTVRPNLNAIALVPENLNGEIASTGFAVLRANRALLDPKYLFYWAQSTPFVDFLVANATGASYPAVSDGIVKRAPIPLASPREQSRIVELLDEADRLRRIRREADAKAARILPALFLKMFGDPATNPKGLPKNPLGKLIKVKSGEFLAAKDMAQDGTFPVYGGNGINGYHDSYMFDDQKIVLGRVGVYCGVVHYSEPKAWITDNALYISEKFEPLDDYYLVAALEQANLNQYAGRAGQPLISGSRIYPVEILIPPENMQASFSKLVQSLLSIDGIKTSASKRIDHLWEILMRRAFAGELTAQWREGHMQELLTEMAQQARALNIPMRKELGALS
jgi:type I restriction enzyme S subunit